jgi:hypothetical protein
MRRTQLAVVTLLIGLTGCFDGFLNESVSGFRNRPVEVPDLPPATLAAAARVDQIGRQLVTGNPFLGIEPTFHTFGSQKPEIYHPDSGGVFVTDGLVQQCKSDAELAAVLASELAEMADERRASDRLRKREPLQPLRDAAALTPGGVASDQNQLGTQALIDRADRKPAPAADSKARAREILESAGFDPRALDAIEPILKETRRHHGLPDALGGGRAERPRWSN